MNEDKSQIYSERNLVILSRYEILEHNQYKHVFAPAPLYRLVTAITGEGEEQTAKEITWERPILHAKIKLGKGPGHHQSSSEIQNTYGYQGQKLDDYTWKTSSSWAEGSSLIHEESRTGHGDQDANRQVIQRL